MKQEIRVFTLNKKSKIEFKPEELEKLLNNIYYEGYQEGRKNFYKDYHTSITNYSILNGDGLKPLI